jgi:hypothetical protein
VLEGREEQPLHASSGVVPELLGLDIQVRDVTADFRVQSFSVSYVTETFFTCFLSIVPHFAVDQAHRYRAFHFFSFLFRQLLVLLPTVGLLLGDFLGVFQDFAEDFINLLSIVRIDDID